MPKTSLPLFEITSPFLTPCEAAERLGISEHELKALVDAKKIPPVWVGAQTVRFSVALIERLEIQGIDIPRVNWRQPSPPRESVEKPFTRVHRARKNYAGSIVGWRKRVLKRDNYRCCRCGCDDRRVLTAHHLKHRNRNPALVLDVENGMTLCENCHKIEHIINPVKRRKRTRVGRVLA